MAKWVSIEIRGTRFNFGHKSALAAHLSATVVFDRKGSSTQILVPKGKKEKAIEWLGKEFEVISR